MMALAEPAPGGGPASRDKFVCHSYRTLRRYTVVLGHETCPTAVSAVARHLGSTLCVHLNWTTGPYQPHRDRQFCYIEGAIKGCPRWPAYPHPQCQNNEDGTGGKVSTGRRVWV